MYRDYYYRYTPSTPKKAKGGIKAKSRTGSFGKSWWAKRWIAVLESFNIGARLTRGRSYARRGQVLDISIEKGRITAKVQGSRSTPYKVTITIKPLKSKEWDTVAMVMAEQAIYSAKLLSGEMPQDIENAFKSAKAPMFPEKSKNIDTDCNCPDWSNPCKHIAAVYYLIGEEFDRDPFLIFRLRGIQREQLMKLIRQYRHPEGEEQDEEKEKNDLHILIDVEDVPLDECVKNFWQTGNIPDNLLGELTEPPAPAALIHRLGTPPFWRSDEDFTATMQGIYSCFSRHCLKILMNEN